MNRSESSGKFLYLALAMLGGLLVVLFLRTPGAEAVPSFARQTGLACSSCHVNPPELTPLGRSFKLNGYTMAGLKQITAPPAKEKAGLALLPYLPLSTMFEISNTGVNKPQPATQNWNFTLPQDVSLFLAGAFSTHAGGFVQVTYDPQRDHFSWDNTDIRYAKNTLLRGKTFVYGVTMNNNPTVEDLWNDTPAWGFPWFASPSAPTPAAAAVVDGPLAQDVAGIGGYGMWNDHLYGAFTLYRSAHLGGVQPNPGTGFDFNLQGIAPYWRFAWQQTRGNNYFEFGTYGLHLRSTPQAITGPTDDYTDFAFDAEYERVLPQLNNNIVTVHTTYIRENSDLNASFAAGDASLVVHHLNTFRIDGLYHFGYRYTPGFGYFVTTGTRDPLFYNPRTDETGPGVPQQVTGSRTGSPNSQGFLFTFAYWPVQNVRLAVHYTAYTTFNGAGRNYDSFGRSAGDNNTVYLHLGLFF
jgi:hypothetical protein